MTLRLAIGHAQTLGLHVIDERRNGQRGPTTTEIEKELNRRSWYSCYAWDCILSLQLGRPRGINLSESVVSIPLPQDDSCFDYKTDTILPLPPGPQPGQINQHAIQFSHIVVEVITDLYSPNMTTLSSPADDRTMNTVERLDKKLLDWRHDLPTHLRFDLDHELESDVVFRTQRNILALKFHHLRALVHRPHLCVEWLTMAPTELAHSTEQMVQRIQASGTICGLEAVNTARMVRGIIDDPRLLREYPW